MLKGMKRLFIILLLTASAAARAEPITQRTVFFSNAQVNVWKTIIYPNKNQSLKMHAHVYNRVVVALTDGTLKVVNNKGEVHYLKFEKDKAYFLTKNVAGETHSDENISHHNIKLVVIEIKS